MSAALIYPLRFTASTANPASIAPLAGANVDMPGMFWAGATTSYFVLDLGSVQTIDTVALIGTNLQASDTWQILTSTGDASGTGGFDSGTLPAFVGFKPDGNRADCIYLTSDMTARYIRVDLASPSNPDAMVTVQRIVVGTAVRSDGVDQEAEKYTDDQSIITSGAGYEAVDEFPTYTGWKITMSWISEAVWRQSFEPLYAMAGSSRGVLFIPDTTQPNLWQSDAIFGRITSKPSGKNDFYDGWTTNPTIQAVSSKLRNR